MKIYLNKRCYKEEDHDDHGDDDDDFGVISICVK